MKLLAASVAFACLPAQAAVAVLSSGASCIYSHVTVSDTGNITVLCEAGPVSPPEPVIPPIIITTTCPAVRYTKVTLPATSPPMQLRMQSGEVASFAMPASVLAGKASVALSQGQQAQSPNTDTEITISRCPGVISKTPNECYSYSRGNNFNKSRDAFRRPVFGWDSQAAIGTRGCWAPAGENWYVNVRWTFRNGCPAPPCGFSMKWEPGSY